MSRKASPESGVLPVETRESHLDDFIGKHFQFIEIIQGDFGRFRQNNRIILSKVAKIALNIFYKLKVFAYKSIRHEYNFP